MPHGEIHRVDRIGWAAPMNALPWIVTASSLVFLSSLGGIAARAGGAPAMTGAVRVGFWGAFAMALTYGVGRMFGAAIR